MNYDEIDDFVNQLFGGNNSGQGGGDNDDQPLDGEVLSGDWRIDRIDQIIQDAYDEAIWWHNHRISDGSDLKSGLRNLPYIPWDERIDGVAAMMGSIGGLSESSYERNGGSLRQYGTRTMSDYEPAQKRDLTCGEVIAVVVVAVCLLIFMLVNS
jgi:hypothetical protein